MHRIADEEGLAAIAQWRDSTSGVAPGGGVGSRSSVPRNTVATAVRFTLQQLGDRAPGGSVEVRVPPFGAMQCIEGTSHRRGTPPAVIETDADTWLSLVTGAVHWADAVAGGRVLASGERADLSGYLPL